MNSYTKLFQSIVTSSIWTEDDQTRIVWITMLALADRNGEVQASIPGLARVSGVSIQATEAAIAKFLAPDPYSRTPDEQGRRVAVIEGGWEIINHPKYRALASREDQKEKGAERVKRYRDRAEKSREPLQPVTTRYASRSVTPCNGPVTHEMHIAEAEAEAEGRKQKRHESARRVLAALNDATGKMFRDVDSNLSLISARMNESGVNEDGCIAMVRRMARKWGSDPKMAEFVRPQTLFGKEKFDGYYAARELPVEKETNPSEPLDWKRLARGTPEQQRELLRGSL